MPSLLPHFGNLQKPLLSLDPQPPEFEHSEEHSFTLTLPEQRAFPPGLLSRLCLSSWWPGISASARLASSHSHILDIWVFSTAAFTAYHFQAPSIILFSISSLIPEYPEVSLDIRLRKMDFYDKVVRTPTTAHSSCSIFALDSPGPQPRVHFGCEHENLYNLDFGSLKTASGYVVGMRSEPRHQLVLDKKYKGHNADEYPIRGSETTGTPSSRLSNGLEYNEGNTFKEEESTYKSLSPPPTPYPAFRALEPELFPPIKGSSCGGYEVYKKSLPFRQLGWSSQGEIVSREISLPTRQVQFSAFPSPMVPPARELPPHRRAVREPLLPMLVYHDNGEEEIVSRYNYLPFGRQARDPTPNALEDLVAEARANGFTTEPECRPHISSCAWYDCVAGPPECESLPSARKKAREDLFAALYRRLESRPPQYNVMPDPPFPWMRR